MKHLPKIFALILLAICIFIVLNLPTQAQNASGGYRYISTATTTMVRSGAGRLLTVSINGGTAGTVTLYDIDGVGCTGTPASGKFATIETIGATNPTSMVYNLSVKFGLCVVTAQASDVTVSFN